MKKTRFTISVRENVVEHILDNLDDSDINDFVEDAIIKYLNLSITDLQKKSLDENNLRTQINRNENINHPYYVYVILDSSKKTNINVLGINFCYEPIYIGKGVDERIFSPKNKNVEKRINEIIHSGHTPIYKKLIENKTNLDAHKIENSLIYLLNQYEEISLCNISGGVNFSGNEVYEAINGTNFIIGDAKVIRLLEELNKGKTIEEIDKILGISQRTIYRMKKRYGIKKNDGFYHISKTNN